MDKITIQKETTIQSYAEFWSKFLFLKESIDPNIAGWSHLKLSALTMACFTIEAFANHIGKHLFPSWKTIGKSVSPDGKLKMFIEMKKMDMKYGESPYNTVHELMKWRNKIAHGMTETIQTPPHTVSMQEYEKSLNRIEQTWREYVITVNIEKIEKDCKDLMEIIHLNALGHKEWFLVGTWQVGSASA